MKLISSLLPFLLQLDEAGFLWRQLQEGETLLMPCSRLMPSIGAPCHELRINDKDKSWRIIYRIDEDAIVILDVLNKTTNKTPSQVIENCWVNHQGERKQC